MVGAGAKAGTLEKLDRVRKIREQLDLFGSEDVLERACRDGWSAEEISYIPIVSRALGEPGSISFLHSGFCLAALPHSKPVDDHRVWTRSNGPIHFMIEPGHYVNERETVNAGVPYGTKSRLIMLFLQTRGVYSPIVDLGDSMSSWLRSLGLSVSGGPRGTIKPVREQALRLSLSRFTLQWDGYRGSSLRHQHLVEENLVDWARDEGGQPWPRYIQLAERFHEALREHRVPLDDHAIAKLKKSSLALDLYVWWAYRLHALKEPVRVSWRAMMDQFGGQTKAVKRFAELVRDQVPLLQSVYPDAKFDVESWGIVLYPSKPAVASKLVVVPKFGVQRKRIVDL